LSVFVARLSIRMRCPLAEDSSSSENPLVGHGELRRLRL
jgi:hypothetical protein